MARVAGEQRLDVERLVGAAAVELVAAGDFHVADAAAARVEHAVLRRAGEDLAADGVAVDVHVRHLGFHLHAPAHAIAAGQRGHGGGGLHLAHVDQADQDGRDDGVTHQGDAVVGRVAVLQGRLQHQFVLGRQHAGLVEDLRHFRRTRVAFGRLPHALRRLRAVRLLRRRTGLRDGSGRRWRRGTDHDVGRLGRRRVAEGRRLVQRRHDDRRRRAACARIGQDFLVQRILQAEDLLLLRQHRLAHLLQALSLFVELPLQRVQARVGGDLVGLQGDRRYRWCGIDRHLRPRLSGLHAQAHGKRQRCHFDQRRPFHGVPLRVRGGRRADQGPPGARISASVSAPLELRFW